MSIFNQAVNYAQSAHYGQLRKYTLEPYIKHPIEVSEIVTATALRFGLPSTIDLPVLRVAAILHDTVEDTKSTYKEIRSLFGDEVCEHVYWLSDSITPDNGGNRETRKWLEARKFRYATQVAKAVKLADLISNASSIIAHDPKFAATYIREAEFVRVNIKETMIDHDFFWALNHRLTAVLRTGTSS